MALAWRPSRSCVLTRTSRLPLAPKRTVRLQPLPDTTVSGAVTAQVIALHIAVGSASLRSVGTASMTKFSFCAGTPLLTSRTLGGEL